MRVFLCSFDTFFLAIPMNAVSSLSLPQSSDLLEQHDNIIAYNQENRNKYLSLPLLFNHSPESIRHAIVLKNPDDKDDDIIENKIILLSTAVERETEIPDDEIFPIPKMFNGTRFSVLFNGMLCANSLILILNINGLINYTQEEKTL